MDEVGNPIISVPDPVPVITIADLTTVDKKDGTGTFDVLMRAVKEHMADEYTQGRIQGAEYSTVYLGALQQTMQQSIAFLLQKDKQSYELQLLQLQADMLELSKLEMQSKIDLLAAQTAKVEQDTALGVLQECNVAAECLQIAAQTTKVEQDTALGVLQECNIEAECLQIAAQTAKVQQDTALSVLQECNVEAECLQIKSATCKLDAEFDLIIQQVPKTLAETQLVAAQQAKVEVDTSKSNQEIEVLKGTENKIGSEIELLAQKFFTERAQTNEEFTTSGSVVGAQTKLYQQQTEGFKRNAEQKAADIMIQTWNTRRMTDDAVAGDASTNQLDDSSIGTFVSALKSGITNQ